MVIRDAINTIAQETNAVADSAHKAFDRLGRKPFAEQLTHIIGAVWPYSPEAYTISLNGRFGTGKTSFLNIWAQYLKDKHYTVIRIDAWETDFDDEPIIPIISALLKHIEADKKSEKMIAALKGAFGAAAYVANGLFANIAGIDIYNTISSVEEELKEEDLKKRGSQLYENYQLKLNAYKALKGSLQQYIEKLKHKPLIILVDELDRVRPDYAIKFLEAIKHIFAVQGLCFVFALDREQLERSVRQVYGDIDFDNYYRRFIEQEVDLPEPSSEALGDFTEMLWEKYFIQIEAHGILFPFKKADDQEHVRNFLSFLCRLTQVTPRQTVRIFQALSRFLVIATSSQEGKVEQAVYPEWLRAAAFLMVVKISNPELYHRLGQETIQPQELLDYINTLNFTHGRTGEEEKELLLRRLFAFSLSVRDSEEKQNEIGIILQEIERKQYGYDDRLPSPNAMINELAKCIERFGRIDRKSVFSRLYNAIEGLQNFIDVPQT